MFVYKSFRIYALWVYETVGSKMPRTSFCEDIMDFRVGHTTAIPKTVTSFGLALAVSYILLASQYKGTEVLYTHIVGGTDIKTVNQSNESG